MTKNIKKLSDTQAREVAAMLTFMKNNIEWTQFKHCNAFISATFERVRLNNGEALTVSAIKSYNTIVAFYDYDSQTLYEVGKYSRTTSKQITQIFRCFFENRSRVFVPCF